MNYCKINGRSYDVLVLKISETFNVLYSENTGRSLSTGARMVLDPLGTFVGHSVVFARKRGAEAEYDELFDLLSTPTDVGVSVEIVHNQTTISYEAYVSQGERPLKRIDVPNNKVIWGDMTVNFIPMEAQVLP